MQIFQIAVMYMDNMQMFSIVNDTSLNTNWPAGLKTFNLHYDVSTIIVIETLVSF